MFIPDKQSSLFAAEFGIEMQAVGSCLAHWLPRWSLATVGGGEPRSLESTYEGRLQKVTIQLGFSDL